MLFWFAFLLFVFLKQLCSSVVDPNLGIEDMLDDFLTFFIAGKTRLKLIQVKAYLIETSGIYRKLQIQAMITHIVTPEKF